MRSQALNNSYGSPYTSKQISVRFDYHLSAKHNVFMRYSHDGNAGFGQSLEFGDPSNWPHNTNWADQGIIGLTSSLTPTIVNDLRFQYNYWGNHNLLRRGLSDCSAPCAAGVLAQRPLPSLGGNFPAIWPELQLVPQGTQYPPVRTGGSVQLAERFPPPEVRR